MLTGKPTGKRPLGRHRRSWEDNIRMNLEEIGISAGNGLIRLDRNYWRALVNATLNLRDVLMDQAVAGLYRPLEETADLSRKCWGS